MIPIILILCVVIALIVLMVKWPKPGVYLYKVAVFVLFLPALFFALFFTLMGLSVNALNIDLHPWREYVMYRFMFAATVTVVSFVVSQIPLMFIRQLSKQEKLKIIKIEGLIYIVILAIGTGLLYYAIKDSTHTENYVIERINDYHKENDCYPDSLAEIGVPSDTTSHFGDIHILYSHNESAFTLLVKSEFEEYVYDSRNDMWNDIPEGESGADKMIVMPVDSDDIIFSDYEKVASWGISEPEFFRLTQSQYERAREILIKHFADSIKPAESGDYLIEHPSGRLEYTAYPYNKYRHQFFGWKDSEGIKYAYIILVSKELIERYMTNGYLNNDKELISLEDGGSDEVDILINLDESKLEVFGVHQHG